MPVPVALPYVVHPPASRYAPHRVPAAPELPGDLPGSPAELVQAQHRLHVVRLQHPLTPWLPFPRAMFTSTHLLASPLPEVGQSSMSPGGYFSVSPNTWQTARRRVDFDSGIEDMAKVVMTARVGRVGGLLRSAAMGLPGTVPRRRSGAGHRTGHLCRAGLAEPASGSQVRRPHGLQASWRVSEGLARGGRLDDRLTLNPVRTCYPPKCLATRYGTRSTQMAVVTGGLMGRSRPTGHWRETMACRWRLRHERKG